MIKDSIVGVWRPVPSINQVTGNLLAPYQPTYGDPFVMRERLRHKRNGYSALSPEQRIFIGGITNQGQMRHIYANGESSGALLAPQTPDPGKYLGAEPENKNSGAFRTVIGLLDSEEQIIKEIVADDEWRYSSDGIMLKADSLVIHWLEQYISQPGLFEIPLIDFLIMTCLGVEP